MSRRLRPAHPGRTLLVVVLAGLLLLSCGGEAERPSLISWLPDWRATESHAPTATTADQLSSEECSSLLTAARQARPKLLPTPDNTLDSPVDEWIVLAESIGFDCHHHPDLTNALADLERLTQTIDGRISALQPTK